MLLDDSREETIIVRDEAKRTNLQLERIKEGSISMSDLRECVQKAKRSSIAAMASAGKVRRMQLQLYEDSNGNVCAPLPAKAPSNTLNARAVCQSALKATARSDMTTAALRAAEAAFSELTEDALACNDVEMSENVITMAKRSLTQCKKAHKLALQQGKRAKNQCQKAEKTVSAQDIRKYQQVADKASRFALKEAKKAERAFIQMRDELDRNVCKQAPQARRSDDATATAICEVAGTASAAFSVATAAAKAANEAFSVLKERALDCYDLQQGQDYIDAAKEVMDECRNSKALTSAAAKQARKLCKKAKRASSAAGFKGMLQNVEVLSREAMHTARTAASQYRRLNDEFDGSFCTEMEVIGPEQDTQTEETAVNGQAGEDPSSATRGAPPPNMNDWLTQIGTMLYEKIPHFLLKEYNSASLGTDCIVAGFNVDVRIQVLARIDERAFWVTEETCNNDSM
jgi:hypothetical protein